MLNRFKKYLVAGVVALAPLLITAIIINWLVKTAAHFSELIPAPYRLETLIGLHLPGIEILFAVAFIILFGATTVHIIGSNLMHWLDLFMERIPVVRSIHKATRQLFSAIFGEGTGAFQKVVMVEYPQPNQWVIGFITGEGPLPGHHSDTPYFSVFIPSTPLPTTGWLLFVAEDKLHFLDLTVDQGMKLVLSGGVLSSPNNPPSLKQKTTT